MSVASDNYDALVVGGGPAGTSAAIHLGLRGARVLLAEQKKFPRAKLCGEFISPECLDHFARLGVSDCMLTAGGAALTQTVFYSRRGRSVSVPSEWFGSDGSCALGLSRAEMDARLLARARAVGVEVLEETQAVGLLIESGSVRGVQLRTNGEVSDYLAGVTIDATGRTRSLARRLEAKESAYHSQDNRKARLVAFKAHLEGAEGADGECEIYFYNGGYGGLSRVEGGLSNLCFIAAARDVRACGSSAERVMREVVGQNRRARKTLARAKARSEWLSVALEGFGRHKLVPADGLLAVGDAASFIDPFTGSGMLMALESGELAAETIARSLSSLRAGQSFERLRDDYRALYTEKFGQRLRVCALLRSAAFIPYLAEAAILTFGASKRMRRHLARATRRESVNVTSKICKP
jgi:flavin-dependent dehydrogenase